MKFLVISFLFSLLLLLLYSRLRPYVIFLRKLLGAAKTMAEPQPDPKAAFRGNATRGDSKLVRCVACGTWIPSERAIGANAGRSVYCSRECLEKMSNGKERKLAG
ncbi:MAG TPA: hypothetical protein DCK99_09865 [Blastocatellia bacterium]|nr:hypothetical protein [Blastocatellia bacterium]